MSRERIEILTKKLKEASDSYYKEGFSQMPDREFDNMLSELSDLEKKFPEFADPHSPTKRVGSDLTDGFKKVIHEVPMISISNVVNWEETKEFLDSVEAELGESFTYTGEFKLDGLSLGVKYRDGIMVQAVTRGDGVQGDDVTENARTISDIPLTIPFKGDLEVRGEVILEKAQFNAINAVNEKNGIDKYQNTRNAASGIIKSKSPKDVARKKLRFVAFGVAAIEGKTLPNQSEDISFLERVGFSFVNKIFPISGEVSFNESMGKIAEVRSRLPFDIDGVVIKVFDKKHREALGRTAKHVKWAKAYKFDSEQARTVVHNVVYQVGRTGRVTPVALLEPVFLAGSTVSKATLHNLDEIDRLGLHIGDTILLEKGGDIIPKVVGVDKSKRPLHSSPVEPAKTCPSCSSTLSRVGDDVDIFCFNEMCPDRLQRAVEYFVARKCMNIMDVGPSLIKKLIACKAIKDPLDLYDLRPAHFLGMEGMGQKSIGKVLDSIDASLKMPPFKVLASLGIRHVGLGTSEKIMNVIPSLDDLSKSSVGKIAEIPDVGMVAAESLKNWFSQNPGIVERLRGIGLNTESEIIAAGGPFEGEVVVVTGTLYTMDREDAHDLVKKGGGRTTGSISKKTTMLVVGENAGSKLDKARKLGTKILTESQFVDMAKTLY